MTKTTPHLALSLLLLLGAACGSSGNDDDGTNSPIAQDPIAPLVEILQPVPTGDYKVEEEVPIKAQVSDDDTDLVDVTLVWQSSLDGKVAEGYPDADGVFIGTIFLSSAGQHQLIVNATDPDGESDTASITITVGDLEPPKASLNAAPSGLQEGDSATITGQVSDAEDDATDLVVEWRLNDAVVTGTQPDAFGNVRMETGPLSADIHLVTLTVTDQDGGSDSTSVNITVDECPDFDRDGYAACGSPGDEVDCDDRDSDINPDADEICGDNEDQDCDGEADEGFPDADSDGVKDCVDECPNDVLNDRDNDGVCGDVDNCPIRSNPDQADLDNDGIGDVCDDTIQELCDGIDNDGDTLIDEGFDSDADGDSIIDCLDDCPLDADNDIDSDGVCGNEDNCPTVSNPGQEDENSNDVGDACDFETCDGEDNDRDGKVDEDFDADGDGYPTCEVDGVPADCDDNDDGAYPGPAEICGDGDDNNCDFVTDRYLDQYEPNGSRGTAYDFGYQDNTTVELDATIYDNGDPDADFYQFTVEDDACCGPDEFVFTAELSQIPSGLNLQLQLYFGADLVDSGTPGAAVQTVTRFGSTGPDDAEFPYYVEVKNLGGTTFEACDTYHLWVSNQE